MLLPPTIKVGTAGWSYPDWTGIVYPRLRPAGFHHAAYLARFFDTLEINTSFYRPVRPELARLWATRVAFNQRFMFTAKLHRSFTHEGSAGPEEEAAFRAMADVLMDSGRLGAVLAQFPWSFKHTAENRAYLAKLLERFREYPMVVEMRHADWLSRPFLELLREHRAGFCNIDQPTLSHGMEPSATVTGRVGYVRFHGRNYRAWFTNGDSESRHERYNYLYPASELEPWVKRITQIAEQANTTYVITNNHYQGKAATNALQLISMLLDRPVEGPEPLAESYPELEPYVLTQAPVQRALFTA